MKILSFIEDPEIIKKILKHLDLSDLKSKPLPRANAPPNNIEPHLDYSDSQLPSPARHLPASARRWQAGRSRLPARASQWQADSGEFPNSGTRKRAGPTIIFMWMSTIIILVA